MQKPIKIFTINLALFGVLIFLIKPFQLIGTDDSGLYLSIIYNFYENQNFNFAYYCGINYLSNHFSPFWALFSVFVPFFSSPVGLYYFIATIGYISFISVSGYLFFKQFEAISFRSIVLFFILFFSSVTILFQFSLNYNGIHDVLFAAPFLLLAYYNLFITSKFKKTIFWFLPTLLIKEEFFLIGIFLFIAIAVKSRKYTYLIGSAVFSILFYLLYFKFMRSLYHGDSVANLGNVYAYLFSSNGFIDLIKNIVKYNDFIKEPFLIITFFLPFVSLVNYKKIEIRDIFGFLILVLPTIGYCFLASGTRMSNMLYDHYGFPILPIIFVFLIKYGVFNKKTILVYLLVNYSLIAFIVSEKQPWQYKFYQDEGRLLSNVIPLLSSSSNIKVATDDRSGIYFADKNLMSIGLCQNVLADYIVVNTRYQYSSTNLTRSSLGTGMRIPTIEYIKQYIDFNIYKLDYADYPFLVYSKNHETPDGEVIGATLLDTWDKKTLESNKWF